MKKEQIYRISFFMTNNTRIWHIYWEFCYFDDELVINFFRESTESHHDHSRYYNEEMSIQKYIHESFPFKDAERMAGNLKIMTSIHYCPFRMKAWISDKDAEDLKKVDKFFSSDYAGSLKLKGMAGLQRYVESINFFNSLQEPRRFSIKQIKTGNEKIINRNYFRRAFLSSPWHGYNPVSYGNSGESVADKIYREVYGDSNSDLRIIKKSVDRRRKKLKKVRPLTKKEQNFFALVGATKNIKQLAQIK